MVKKRGGKREELRVKREGRCQRRASPSVGRRWRSTEPIRPTSVHKSGRTHNHLSSFSSLYLSISFILSLFILSFSSLFLSQFVVHSSKTKSFVTIRIFISRQISNSDFKRFIQDLIIQNKIVG